MKPSTGTHAIANADCQRDVSRSHHKRIAALVLKNNTIMNRHPTAHKPIPPATPQTHPKGVGRPKPSTSMFAAMTSQITAISVAERAADWIRFPQLPMEGNRMRRIALMLVTMLVLGLPLAAFAQIDEEALAAAILLKEKADALDGEDADAWTEGLAEVEAALADLKAKAANLDYAELDAAIVDLQTAIDGGDVSEMETAGAAAAAAAAGVLAEAEAEAGDGTEEPTGVSTGDEVPTGPNVALLAVAGVLALLAGGALALRRTVDRR